MTELWREDHRRLLKEFEQFLGSDRVDQKLTWVERTLKASSPISRLRLVEPQQSLWLGLKKARTAFDRKEPLRVSDPDIRRAILFSLRFGQLRDGMPSWKRTELRSRLLGRDEVEPVQLELEAGAALALRGYGINWIQPTIKKTPEFVADAPNFKLEVECKSLEIDSGRMVTRRNLCDLCNEICASCPRSSLSGVFRDVRILVPRELTGELGLRREMVSAILSIWNGGRRRLSNGTELRVELLMQTTAALAPELAQFEHRAIVISSDTLEPTVVIRCASRESDDILRAVYKRLVAALGQFSGARPAKIVCYLPEVSSFDGLDAPDSGLYRMTRHFFSVHKRAKHVVLVEYVSDVSTEPRLNAYSVGMPSLPIGNPYFETPEAIGTAV